MKYRVKYMIGRFGKFKDFDDEQDADRFVKYLKGFWEITGTKEFVCR